jgi:hypothetical protein
MSSFIMLAAFAVAAFLVAWIVNALVGLLMGEKPRDTASLWFDIFFRFFAALELGVIGRFLSYLGLTGAARKAIFFVGTVCVLLFLVRACRGQTDSRHPHTYTFTNGHLYEITIAEFNQGRFRQRRGCVLFQTAHLDVPRLSSAVRRLAEHRQQTYDSRPRACDHGFALHNRRRKMDSRLFNSLPSNAQNAKRMKAGWHG